MNFFGFIADSLKMPYIVEEQGIQFLRHFSKWKWYSSRIEINSNSGHQHSLNTPQTALPIPKISKFDSYSSNFPKRVDLGSHKGSRKGNLRKEMFFKKYGQMTASQTRLSANRSINSSNALSYGFGGSQNYRNVYRNVEPSPQAQFFASKHHIENMDALKESFRYLSKNIKFRSYLSHNTVKEKIALNIPYMLDLRDKKPNFSKMSKIDKLFIMTESLSVLKEKEIMRLIKNHRSKSNITMKQIDPRRTLSCYFGKAQSIKISNAFKLNS